MKNWLHNKWYLTSYFQRLGLQVLYKKTFINSILFEILKFDKEKSCIVAQFELLPPCINDINVLHFFSFVVQIPC